jgi:hypothetical protein
VLALVRTLDTETPRAFRGKPRASSFFLAPYRPQVENPPRSPTKRSRKPIATLGEPLRALSARLRMLPRTPSRPFGVLMGNLCNVYR